MVRLQNDNICIRTSIDLLNYVYLRTCRHVRVADLSIIITVTDDTVIKCGELYNTNVHNHEYDSCFKEVTTRVMK